VSGHNLIKMDALRRMFEGLKFKDVTTYIQSGNVVFKAKPEAKPALQKQISKQIQLNFGFEVPVLVLEQSELKRVIATNPFLKRKQIDLLKLHVTFLYDLPGAKGSTKPDASAAQLKDLNFAPDEFEIVENAVYLHCPNGYGNTKLSNSFFENKLKRSATTRNWKTLNELLNLSGIAKK